MSAAFGWEEWAKRWPGANEANLAPVPIVEALFSEVAFGVKSSLCSVAYLAQFYFEWQDQENIISLENVSKVREVLLSDAMRALHRLDSMRSNRILLILEESFVDVERIEKVTSSLWQEWLLANPTLTFDELFFNFRAHIEDRKQTPFFDWVRTFVAGKNITGKKRKRMLSLGAALFVATLFPVSFEEACSYIYAGFYSLLIMCPLFCAG